MVKLYSNLSVPSFTTSTCVFKRLPSFNTPFSPEAYKVLSLNRFTFNSPFNDPSNWSKLTGLSPVRAVAIVLPCGSI